MMIEGQLDIRAVHAKVWLGRNYWSFRRKRFPTFAHFCNVGHIQLRSASVPDTNGSMQLSQFCIRLDGRDQGFQKCFNGIFASIPDNDG